MSTTTQILFNSPALHSLKRDQLVKLCKIHSIKANGKNVDLVERLKTHAKNLPRDSPLSVAIRSEQENAPQNQDGDEEEEQRMPRPSSQWELVMDSITEEPEESSSSQGTLSSQRSGGTLTHEFRHRHRQLKQRPSAHPSALSHPPWASSATPPHRPRASTIVNSVLLSSFPQPPTDELSMHSTPYSLLPPPSPSSAPQTDHLTIPPEALNPSLGTLNPTLGTAPLPGHTLRPGLPAPANARLSLGLAPRTPSKAGPTTTIRLVSFSSNTTNNNNTATPQRRPLPPPGDTPNLKPFSTAFELDMGSPDGAFAGFAGGFSPSASAFPPTTSTSALPSSAFGITPLADASSSALYPALPASPPVDDTARRMSLEAARAYGHDDAVCADVSYGYNDDSVALDHTFALNHTGMDVDDDAPMPGAFGDAPMPGAFDDPPVPGTFGAPMTPPTNKFDFVFGSGGVTPFKFAVPARGANGDHANSGNSNNGNGANNTTNGGGTTDQTKAEILAELDRRVFGGSAIPVPSSPIGSRPIRPLGSARKSAGGSSKPAPAPPGRFDKAHAAAFARMESIAVGGLKRKASVGDGVGGKRVRVEGGAAEVDSKDNTNMNPKADANTNDTNTNTNANNADAGKDTAQKDKDKDEERRRAVRRQLEANRARRRSSAVGGRASGVGVGGRVSGIGAGGRRSSVAGKAPLGQGRGVLQKPKPTKRLGFFAGAAKLVRGVWGSRGAAVEASTSASATAKTTLTSAASSGTGTAGASGSTGTGSASTGTASSASSKSKSAAKSKLGKMGPPAGPYSGSAGGASGPSAGANTNNSNSGVGGPSANASGLAAPNANTSSANNLAAPNANSLAAPSSASRLRAPSVRSVGSTASGRARSPLPPSFGGAGARGSGVMGTRNSGSSVGTRSSAGAGASSMGTRTSSVASSMGTRISSMGTRISSMGTRTSSMGTRTMSSVAGSSMGVGTRARDGSLGTRGSVSSAASKARPTSRLLAPTASSLAKMSGGVLEGITNGGSPAPASAAGEGDGEGEAAPRKKLLPARRPRISRSRVIAKLASQRVASASSAASAASGSGAQRKSHGGGGRARSSMGAKVLRGSMGGMKNGGGGGGLGAGGADAKRRARQSEYYARRRSRGAGGADVDAMVVDE
ncbi:hypothetical protein C8J57DRAFT_1211510 [Mycena rebaudengoi]|nr:hypothetical protein C8J57DRAFT_1211510 [Mycena rebaudengoi]